jgi:carbonic anhydrase/acetyltransferase-like protein (isoleucine patch superfamily)
VGDHSILSPGAVLGGMAEVGSHCVVGDDAIVGKGARVGDGASLDPGCELGAEAFLGPGARLLDRTRLPTGEPGKPARVGEQSRVGGHFSSLAPLATHPAIAPVTHVSSDPRSSPCIPSHLSTTTR